MAITISRSYKTIILLVLIIASAVFIRAEYVREGGDKLLRYDPYYHYRMAETIVDKGHRPEWDSMASWPTGEPVRHPPLYHYFLAYTYHTFGWIAGNNLLLWCNYSCVIPVILFVVLAYIVGYYITDTKGGIFCAALFALAAFPVRRTLIGFADTDGFILIFSLLITYFWIKSFSKTNLAEKRTFMYAALCGFSIFLFELTWRGYWHMLILVTGASFIVIVIQYIKKKKMNFLPTAIMFLAFFIPHIFYSGQGYQGLILVALVVALLLAIHTQKWPQYTALFAIFVCMYFLYAEGYIDIPFPKYSLGETIVRAKVFYPYIGPYISQRQGVTGSYLLKNFTITLFLAPLGIYALLKKQKINIVIYIILYLMGGISMIFSGVRFLLIFTVPVLILSSAALSFLWGVLVKNSPGRKVVSACFIVLLFVPVYVTAEQVNGAEESMESSWWDTLQWINTNTPQDAVVLADWGYGYYIESIAKRKSIMNGGHYDINWRLLKFGKMLETSSEKISVKEVFGFETTEEVKKIRQFPQGEKGVELMEKEMTGFAVENQDAYIVLDSRTAMVFDIISRWGTWDYTTGEGSPITLYRGVSAGTVLQPHYKQYLYDTAVHQIIVYKSEGEYHSFILENNTLVPTEGTIYSDEKGTYFLKRETGKYGVVWVSSDSLIFIPSDALDSMMVRLYFFNGEKSTHFELVADFGDIKVFKIHRQSKSNLNEPVITKIDTWRPE